MQDKAGVIAGHRANFKAVFASLIRVQYLVCWSKKREKVITLKVFKFIPEWKLLWSCYSSDDVFVTDLSAEDMTAVSFQLRYLDLKKGLFLL